MVKKEEIITLSKLAKLKFTDEEIEHFTKEMDEIIDFANRINAMSSTGEEVIDKVVPLEQLRDDVVVESLPQEVITSNVESIDGFFPVKRSNAKR
ncbi:MAG TPA: Asp-tRNA(Asn)/Glu-tRNA(Gln) amidotransferase GatCAB subunit C [Clostridiales bacterium]|nr:Asp-tRNA(Asn)/Glu-tRNA(Gln) amidotransferase GatCAB subunit C [Clostridiales bacterium]HBJ98042.1 Asp-tRNA(Asn)/Glu-tRNA(Gln) amidotransferase GatCAB subunit C [Clostridiales bacterium]